MKGGKRRQKKVKDGELRRTEVNGGKRRVNRGKRGYDIHLSKWIEDVTYMKYITRRLYDIHP